MFVGFLCCWFPLLLTFFVIGFLRCSMSIFLACRIVGFHGFLLVLLWTSLVTCLHSGLITDFSARASTGLHSFWLSLFFVCSVVALYLYIFSFSLLGVAASLHCCWLPLLWPHAIVRSHYSFLTRFLTHRAVFHSLLSFSSVCRQICRNTPFALHWYQLELILTCTVVVGLYCFLSLLWANSVELLHLRWLALFMDCLLLVSSLFSNPVLPFNCSLLALLVANAGNFVELHGFFQHSSYISQIWPRIVVCLHFCCLAPILHCAAGTLCVCILALFYLALLLPCIVASFHCFCLLLLLPCTDVAFHCFRLSPFFVCAVICLCCFRLKPLLIHIAFSPSCSWLPLFLAPPVLAFNCFCLLLVLV